MDELPKYNVVVSPKARDMLFEHAQFLAKVSVEAAKSLFDRFEERVDSLETMPERFPYYDNPCVKFGKYRKVALGKHLLILFQVDGSTVYIDLIIDVRADNRSFPNDREALEEK